jgi:voltage-gated potassium channel
MAVILLNVAAAIAVSFNDYLQKHRNLLLVFEYISVGIFTVEYMLRLITADYKFPESKFSHIKYIFSFLVIVDLLAILPFYCLRRV